MDQSALPQERAEILTPYCSESVTCPRIALRIDARRKRRDATARKNSLQNSLPAGNSRTSMGHVADIPWLLVQQQITGRVPATTNARPKGTWRGLGAGSPSCHERRNRDKSL